MGKMDPELKRLVVNLARRIKTRHEDTYGTYDKEGIHADTLDEFEEEYADFVPVALRGGWSFFVWEVLRKDWGQGRSQGVAEASREDGEDAQPKLPSQEWAEFAVYNVPIGGGKYEAKRVERLTTEEVRATRREYEKRGREMFQQARPLLAYEREMDRREFGPSETVRDLYRKSA
jgi:hypothetical protein